MPKIISFQVDDPTHALLSAHCAATKTSMSHLMRAASTRLAQTYAKQNGLEYDKPPTISPQYMKRVKPELMDGPGMNISAVVPRPVYNAIKSRAIEDNVPLGMVIRTALVRAMGFGVAKCEDLRSPASKAVATRALLRGAVVDTRSVAANVRSKAEPYNLVKLPDYPEDMPGAEHARRGLEGGPEGALAVNVNWNQGE